MLNRKYKYLQVALNSTLSDARDIINQLPPSEKIIIEAGTPLIKNYGMDGVRSLFNWWQQKVGTSSYYPYIAADMKTMDRGETEVQMAKAAGASAVIALGQSPLETINSFIENCNNLQIDSMLDMMNIEQPVKILRQLKNQPKVVILHRGVDEEKFNRDKPVPYLQINKIRSSFDVLISVAGGDTIREVQRAIFNDANIVVVWKEFYSSSQNTGALAEEFLKVIK